MFRPLVGFLFMWVYILLLCGLLLAIYRAFGEPRRPDWMFLGLVVTSGAAAALAFGLAREFVARGSRAQPYIVGVFTSVVFWGTMLAVTPSRVAKSLPDPGEWLIFGAVVLGLGLVGGFLLRSNGGQHWRRSA